MNNRLYRKTVKYLIYVKTKLKLFKKEETNQNLLLNNKII